MFVGGVNACAHPRVRMCHMWYTGSVPLHPTHEKKIQIWALHVLPSFPNTITPRWLGCQLQREMESCLRNFAEEEAVYVVTVYWISLDCSFIWLQNLSLKHTTLQTDQTLESHTHEAKASKQKLLFYWLNNHKKPIKMTPDSHEFNVFKWFYTFISRLASGKCTAGFRCLFGEQVGKFSTTVLTLVTFYPVLNIVGAALPSSVVSKKRERMMKFDDKLYRRNRGQIFFFTQMCFYPSVISSSPSVVLHVSAAAR